MWQVRLQWDGVMASSSDAVSRTTRESSTLATTMRPSCLTMDNSACNHVGLLLEVELAVAKFLLVIDERRQRKCLLLIVFVQGFK
jgi:hypothetical protein